MRSFYPDNAVLYTSADIPEVDSNVSTRRAHGRGRSQQDRIREQESFLLDIFSQDLFFKVMMLTCLSVSVAKVT